jgi:deazaflavin-dependent oxidoreductase (nitroreductase family)
MTAPSLVEHLGYRYPEPGSARRSIIGLVATRPLSWANSKIAHHLDRWVLATTGGKTTATSALTGLPVLFVTTTGVRTGQARTVPLLGIPFESTLGLIGTGFGQPATPGWVHNLHANPSATVRYRRQEARVTARLARLAEAERIWSTATAIYPGYASYPVWAAHREISLFVLEPAPPETDG